MEQYYNLLESSHSVIKSVKRTVKIGTIDFTVSDYSFKFAFKEDKLYEDPHYRHILTRGCCITLIQNVPVHVLNGHPKFGYEGDYISNETVVSRFFTRKENGQCGHVSAFRIPDSSETYLIIGSKNVHIVVRQSCILEDVQTYLNTLEKRYIVATNIASLLAKSYSDRIPALAEFCVQNATTFCCEAIFKDDQHLVDYNGEESLKFFAITHMRQTINSPLTWCNPLQAIKHFKQLQLDTVTEYGVFNDEISEKIRQEPNSEGAVVNCLNSSGEVIYVYKYKNDTYAFLRAVREQMRHNASNSDIQKRIANLHFNHNNCEELTNWSMKFNAYYNSLDPSEKSEFFSHWIDHANKFNQMTSCEPEKQKLNPDEAEKQTGLDVVMFVGIQGSGKSTVARTLRHNLISKLGYSEDEVVHLEQDMFGGNPKLYHTAIKKSVQNPRVKILFLAKMNHTQFVRKSTKNVIASVSENRKVNYSYVVFDLLGPEFYVERIKQRGKTHSSLVYSENTLSIIEQTITAYDPISPEEENSVHVLHLPSDNTLQNTLQVVFKFLQPFRIEDIEEFDENVPELAEHSKKYNTTKKIVKKQPLYDCIKLDATDCTKIIQNQLFQLEKYDKHMQSFHITTYYYGYGNVPYDKNFTEGIEVEVKIIGYAKDENCFAFICDKSSLSAYLEPNRTPHITCALKEGVKAVYSNSIINDTTKIVMFDEDSILHIRGKTQRIF